MLAAFTRRKKNPSIGVPRQAMWKMPGRQAIPPFRRVPDSLMRKSTAADPGGKRTCVFVLMPKIVSSDRQRQVMASPAMGSQAYRFTGWGKTLSLDYVSRSVGP